MPTDDKQTEALSPEIQEVMRALVSAMRVVKLYPPNNPIYSQSVKKSFETLDQYLATAPDYVVGVQKSYFTYRLTPVGKEGQMNRAIAQDLFAKGIREIVFTTGVSEQELLEFYRAISLSSEELSMKSGITSVLWEQSVSHIKVTEAGLDEVVVAQEAAETGSGKKDAGLFSRTLAVGDLLTDPAGFAAGMLELAKRTRDAHESVEHRLFTLYQEAGREIREEHPEQSEELFSGLADSALALASPVREGLIGGQLYGALDADIIEKQKTETEEHVPSPLHEIQTARFSRAWNTEQVSTLLKKTASAEVPQAEPLPSPAAVEAVPLPGDLISIAKEMAEYSPEEMAELKTLGDAGAEPDIIKTAAHTLLSLIPLVKNAQRTGQETRETTLMAGIVHQLEDLLTYCIMKKEYDVAGLIVEAFQKRIDPSNEQRMAEALQKASSPAVLLDGIEELRNHHRDAREYRAAHSYLSRFKREALEVLLSRLAEEQDRAARTIILQLVKDFGKEQIAVIGERLSDGRWSLARDIVNLLGEIRTEQAVDFLCKAAEHEDVRIRRDVIKALRSIGGKKSAGALSLLLRDKDEEVQLAALRAFPELPGIGAEESLPLVEFLRERPLKKQDLELILEAIKALGKIGGRDAEEFLERYTRIKWWKPRKLQKELKEAARRSREGIERRLSSGG